MKYAITYAFSIKRLTALVLSTAMFSSTVLAPVAYADHCSTVPPMLNGHVNQVDDSPAKEQIQQKKLSGPAHVRTGPRQLKKFVAKLSFSAHPSDIEMSTAHALPELLVPMSGNKVSGENEALAHALLSFHNKNNKEDLSDLQKFVTDYPNSRWRPSVELNMALMDYETANVTRALELFQDVWTRSKHESSLAQCSVANRAIGMLCQINAHLGRTKELDQLLGQLHGRRLLGSDEQLVDDARLGLAIMRTQPEKSFKCGPFAIDSILSKDKPRLVRTKLIEDAKSTTQGTNFVEVRDLAKKAGLNMQLARRSPNAPLVVPSVMHWRLDHFGAIVRKEGDHYEIKDPTFGSNGSMLASAKTLDTEGDGVFLVPSGSLPSGYTAVSDEEAKNIWGKGVALEHGTPNGHPNTWQPPPCINPGFCPPCGGMARASMWYPLNTINITDTPLSYDSPLGTIAFTLNYNQDEPNQPSSFSFTNFGLNWKYGYGSYLTVGPGSVLTVRCSDGGSETASLVSGSYPPNPLTQAYMVNTGTSYERHFPDGSVDVYDQVDTNGNWFMTKRIDALGNSVLIQYDSNFRITTVTDYIGQVSTFAY